MAGAAGGACTPAKGVSTLAQNEVVCPSCGSHVPVSAGETEKECPNCGIRMDIRTTIEDAEIAEAGGEDQVTA
jgi:predicted RNA-binding Zn-ribbon protein involved in translation (DUF1610 family)